MKTSFAFIGILIISSVEAMAVIYSLDVRSRLIEARLQGTIQSSQAANWAYNGIVHSADTHVEQTASSDLTKPSQAPEAESTINGLHARELIWAVCGAPYRGSWPRVFAADGKEMLNCANMANQDNFGVPNSPPERDLLRIATAAVIDLIYPNGVTKNESDDRVASALQGQRAVYLQRRADGRLVSRVSAPLMDKMEVAGAVLFAEDCTDIDEYWRAAVLWAFAGALMLSCLVLAVVRSNCLRGPHE